MGKKTDTNLSRRERQIMDVIYQKGSASAADVLAGVPEPPSYSAVRALLRILESKGHLKHRKEGVRYLYSPTRSRTKAARTAVRRLLNTFFDGSAEKAMVALLDASDSNLNEEELGRLREMIDQAGRRGS